MERVAALLLGSGLILAASVGSEPAAGPGSAAERGRMELRRVHNLAAQPQFGECWTRALENLETRCKEMTSESQSRLALRFTHCHLSSAGRKFPPCPEGSEVSRCTARMDPVAFNAFTEFFTHTHSICHFLQAEAWRSRAESTMYRLTETSAGVAEQLHATREVADDLMEAQTAALQAQREILSNGEQLRVTLRESTQGVQAVFSDLSSASREQQVALSELFNRISFLQSFLLMEAHSLSSCCYNAAALCTAYLLTSTPRSSTARLVLLALVCLNFYLERKIYQFVLRSPHPEHLHMELVSAYVSVLRRVSLCLGGAVLLVACVRYRDPVQQSLQVLQQLRETHRDLQEALQLAERLTQEKKKLEDCGLHVQRSSESLRRRKKEEEEPIMVTSPATDSSHLSQPSGSPRRRSISHHASVPSRRPAPPSPLVYSFLVEEKPRYSLRSRRGNV